jgi:hypothetical protein
MGNRQWAMGGDGTRLRAPFHNTVTKATPIAYCPLPTAPRSEAERTWTT